MVRYINIKSRQRNEFIDVTARVEEEIAAIGVISGVCFLFVPHTTAAITINEGADPSVRTDILSTLERLVPRERNYRHAEGNSDAHVKSSAVGVSVFLPVEDGRLVLGTWQAVYFCEFDGPRHRRIALKMVPGKEAP